MTISFKIYSHLDMSSHLVTNMHKKHIHRFETISRRRALCPASRPRSVLASPLSSVSLCNLRNKDNENLRGK